MLWTLCTVLTLLRLTVGLQPVSAEQPKLTGGMQRNTAIRPGLTTGLQPMSPEKPKLTGGMQRNTAVRPGQADEEQLFCRRDPLTNAVNDFGFALAERLPVANGGNMFFSPLSVSVSLAMTYLGAAGETARQLDRVMGYRDNNLQPGDVHMSFRRLLSGLSSGNNDYRMLVANGLFLQAQYKVQRDYVDRLHKSYGAVVGYVEFAGVGAETALNGWVSNATKGAIPKLFNGQLDPLTRMALLNAVYFKGTWKVHFPRNATYPGTFFKSDGSSKMVNFMLLHDEEFRFYEDENLGYKFLELPYKGNRMAMLLALPRRSDAPADLKMTTALLCRVNASLRTAEVREVALPRFKLQYTAPLKTPIAAMGAVDLFRPGIADLSGIRPLKDVQVDSIFHKAVLEVNEEGSEAAAASGVVMTKFSLQSKPSFVANHPFLLYIIDKSSGLVIFSGKVSSP